MLATKKSDCKMQTGFGQIGKIGECGCRTGKPQDLAQNDAQQLPLPVAPEGAEHRRVFEGGIDLGLELIAELAEAGAAPQRDAKHVDVVGVVREQVAEHLAGAEELEQDLEGAGAVVEQGGELRRAGGAGEVALEIVQRHVRVGTARQDAGQRHIGQIAFRMSDGNRRVAGHARQRR